MTIKGDTTVLSTYTQSFDLASNVVRIVEDYATGGLQDRTVVNGYDEIGRLESEAITDGTGTVTTAYTYDDSHNRLTKTVGAVTTDYEYNDRNQLKEWDNGTTSSDFEYDQAGNRVSETRGTDEDTYEYDYDNRLVKLTKEIPGTDIETGIHEYAYDYRTRRVLRDETGASGVATQLVFSGGTSVQEYEIGGAATPVVEYIRGSDYGGGVGGILYSLRGTTPSFTHYNSRGDVVAKTSASGSLTYQAAYEAFGKRNAEQGATDDRQKANTKEEDPTGLLNEGFRYRCLETGVFITRDPAGFVDGPNLYTYVVQNPWTMFDPLGLAALIDDDLEKYSEPSRNSDDQARQC